MNNMNILSLTIGLIVGIVSTSAYVRYKMDIEGLLNQTELIEQVIFILLIIFLFISIAFTSLKFSVTSPSTLSCYI